MHSSLIDATLQRILRQHKRKVASDLIGHITKEQQAQWQAGGPVDWAQESFKIAKDDAFGQLPEPNSHGSFRLSDEYVTMAVGDVEAQLSRAGFRLAQILNQVLRKQEVSNR